jgi:hypothetical protein
MLMSLLLLEMGRRDVQGWVVLVGMMIRGGGPVWRLGMAFDVVYDTVRLVRLHSMVLVWSVLSLLDLEI